MQPFQLEPVIAKDMKDFIAHPLASTLAGIFSLAYSRNIINDLKALSPGIQHIEYHYGSDLFLSMLRFTIDKVDNSDVDTVIETAVDLVTDKTRGDVMTLSEQLVDRGRKQGIQQGIQQRSRDFAKKLIQKGMDDEFIASTTDLSIVEIKKIRSTSEAIEQLRSE